MTHLTPAAARCLVLAASLLLARIGAAQVQEQRDTLPTPLRLEDVLRYAREHRQEIVAAQARTRAADQRPDFVSALDDPMVMPSVDHLPFKLHGVDASLMIEQSFPLSGVLGHRRRAADADARRLRADSERVALDVQLDAARAFLMLRERREMARILNEQVVLARQFVSAANARYSSGTGNQPEVLRAEVEVARLEGAIRVIAAEAAAGETMLNASLGRPVEAAIPELAGAPVDREPAPWTDVRTLTLRHRPEFEAGRAEIGRAQAEISVMETMYLPMGFVRTGPAYTMTDRWGWMLMVGVSVPIWRGKYDAGVREARAMEDMAHADLSAMTRMIEGEAASARNQVIAARRRVAALRDDVLPRARQSIEPSLAAYAAGTMPLVSVIDAAQALWSLEAELVSAEFELGLAWARFHRAQGQFETGARR
ncbi:MAG: hypothetical protein GMKNLPBB_03097 [Myxococcota bacterium]|nr:hypothetical protein [Myxococcota bacterium]